MSPECFYNKGCGVKGLSHHNQPDGGVTRKDRIERSRSRSQDACQCHCDYPPPTAPHSPSLCGGVDYYGRGDYCCKQSSRQLLHESQDQYDSYNRKGSPLPPPPPSDRRRCQEIVDTGRGDFHGRHNESLSARNSKAPKPTCVNRPPSLGLDVGGKKAVNPRDNLRPAPVSCCRADPPHPNPHQLPRPYDDRYRCHGYQTNSYSVPAPVSSPPRHIAPHHPAPSQAASFPVGAGVVTDDEDAAAGHFCGCLIAKRYGMLRQVGLGTFGRVVKCVDLQRHAAGGSNYSSTHENGRRCHGSKAKRSTTEGSDDYVAVKILGKARRSAAVEASIVEELNRLGGRGLTHCVVLHDSFTWKGHYCMVFENLGPSLYDFLKMVNYHPFPIEYIQDFALQLLQALEFLHGFGLIHTDLKVENILLTSPRKDTFGGYIVPSSTQIKIIDFGGACYDNDTRKASLINTRQYRAPEVILGTGWSMPSDLWSAGCVLAELYQGELLFRTHDNLEHLALMERIVEPFPGGLLKRARDLTTSPNEGGGGGNLADAAFDSSGRHRMERVLSPQSAASVKKSAPLHEMVRNPAHHWLLSLLRRILVIEPTARATAHETLVDMARIGIDRVRYR